MKLLTKLANLYLGNQSPTIEAVDINNGFFVVRYDPDSSVGIRQLAEGLLEALNANANKNVGFVCLPIDWTWDQLTDEEFLDVWRSHKSPERVEEALGIEAFEIYQTALADRYRLEQENIKLNAIVGSKLRGDVLDTDMLTNE